MIHDVVPEHRIWEPDRLPCTSHPHDVEAVSSRHTKVGNAGDEVMGPRGGGDRTPRAGGPPLPRAQGHRESARHLRYARRRVAVWGRAAVHSTSSGNVVGTATRPWTYSSVWRALPLGPERTVLVRSTSSGSVRACSPCVRRRVAVWAALPLGPERAVPCGGHCHSGLDVPFRYA